MKSRTRKASWFVSGLILVTVLSAGLKLVVAQPKSETSRPAVDAGAAVFVSLGERYIININNIAYTSDDDVRFDIYFACSSGNSPDPLRLTDAKDIRNARAYFNDEKRYGRHFLKINKYCISMRNIAYIEPKNESIVVNFNIRINDDFVDLPLFGADAETFRKKMRDF